MEFLAACFNKNKKISPHQICRKNWQQKCHKTLKPMWLFGEKAKMHYQSEMQHPETVNEK